MMQEVLQSSREQGASQALVKIQRQGGTGSTGSDSICTRHAQQRASHLVQRSIPAQVYAQALLLPPPRPPRLQRQGERIQGAGTGETLLACPAQALEAPSAQPSRQAGQTTHCGTTSTGAYAGRPHLLPQGGYATREAQVQGAVQGANVHPQLQRIGGRHWGGRQGG